MVYQEPYAVDWERLSTLIAGKVRAKLLGRLRNFELHHVEGEFILGGECATYHVKQLAQEEVIVLSPVPIRRNGIQVVSN